MISHPQDSEAEENVLAPDSVPTQLNNLTEIRSRLSKAKITLTIFRSKYIPNAVAAARKSCTPAAIGFADIVLNESLNDSTIGMKTDNPMAPQAASPTICSRVIIKSLELFVII